MRLSFALLAAAFAGCSSFDTAPATPDAGAVQPSADGGSTDEKDGEAPKPDGAVVDAGLRCDPTMCPQVMLYTPTTPPPSGEVEYPFSIATDEASVYWLSLAAPTTDSTLRGDAYNGTGLVRVRRASKTQPGQSTLLYSGTLRVRAEAIAVSGGFVHFALRTVETPKTTRFRFPSDCSGIGSCQPTTATFTAGVIKTMVTGTTNDVWWLQDNGPLYQLTGETMSSAFTDWGTLTLPDITRSADHLFVAGLTTTTVYGLTLNGVNSLKVTLPPLDPPATDQGASALAADTKELFMLRDDAGLWSAPIINGASATRWADTGVRSFYDLALDERSVFAAAANAGGVFVFDRTTRKSDQIFEGNVWRIAVDAQGVYWGDHKPNDVPGAIWMMRK